MYSPCVIVGPDENVVHDDSAVLAGVAAEFSQQWKQFRQLLEFQKTQHGLTDVESRQLRWLIPETGRERERKGEKKRGERGDK